MLDQIISRLPGVEEPKSHLSFKSRLKWTAVILLLFFVMGQITIYGVAAVSKERFQFYEMILGSSMGTIITLGIGPIVSASIILQLLVGSKIIPWDLKTKEGRKRFQGSQKLLAIFFCIFEAFAFVSFGAVQPTIPSVSSVLLLVAQLAIGSFLLLLMDEVVSKWGIGSGVSLFIAAGVTKGIFVRALNPLPPTGESMAAGLIPQSISLLGLGEIFQAFVALLPIIATLLVFAIVVYVQAMKVDIPLAFTSIRGFSRRWPLKLIYTSNIPVILVAALLANILMVGNMMATPVEAGGRCGIFGCFDDNGNPTSGIVSFMRSPNALSIQIFFLVFLLIVFLAGFLAFYMKYKNAGRIMLISSLLGIVLALVATSSLTGLPTIADSSRALAYFFVMVIGSVIFSIFWVSTSGMDSHSVAEQIEGMGMQIPGFRRDPRIVEQVLDRYIPSLAVISGVFIGALASLADFTGALGTGTGILLTVMIIYNFYEQISMRYMEDMHPALKKFFG
ncbi:MAG: preprotein translocase subunit SecY [Candidatus Aenigmatarchaeota archaeon]